jgi:hypothetical protein
MERRQRRHFSPREKVKIFEAHRTGRREAYTSLKNFVLEKLEVRALQSCVLAEKAVGPVLFDHLPSAFGIPQEAYQVPHSAGLRLLSRIAGCEVRRIKNSKRDGFG